jgi:cobalamin biosynthesis Mg chelatase CobN
VSSLNYRLWVTGLFGASLSLFGLGCATGSGEVRHGAGAGYWEGRVVTLPARQSPIEAMAFGRGGSSKPASDLGVDDALAALDSAAIQTDARPNTAPRSAKLMAAKQAAQPTEVAQADVTEHATQPTVESAVQADQPVLLAANTQESRYASREAASEDQQKFQGGDAIVITSGAIVLVLLIVLLVLLLR